MADEPKDFMDWQEEESKPKVKRRDWMASKVMELVTAATLDRVIDECIESGLYAWDIETTGLDNRVFFNEQGETSTPDKITGHCLSPDGVTGYYIPIRHVDAKGNPHEANVSVSKTNRALKRLADSESVAIFHNAKFDQEFLQFSEAEMLGEWDDPSTFDDTFILAYVRNTRERRKGLKHLSLQELGFEMIELPELFPEDDRKKKNFDFSKLDPSWEPVLWYATSDAICTYLLHQVLHPEVHNPEPHGQSQKTIYTVEKMCLPSTRWMERNRIYIDRVKVEELIRLGQEEWFASLEEVYVEASKILTRNIRPGWFRLMQGTEDIAGASNYTFNHNQINPHYMDVRLEAKKQSDRLTLDPQEVSPKGKNRIRTTVKEVPNLVNPKRKEKVPFPEVYDLTIPAQLGLMLRELGVRGLKATEKSGQVKTDKATLDGILERAGTKFPFMGKVKRFRETAKALGTNLFPIWNDTTPERAPDECVRVGFNGFKVDTGRFATPQPRDKTFHGQVRWNLHSIPATYDKKKPACMLRIRECVKALPGHYLFAIDYAGVELRIATNLSREPKWLAEFFRCNGCESAFPRGDGRSTPPVPPSFCPKCGSDKIGDLHSLTAIGVYGLEITNDPKVFKGKRQNAKALNFAMCYGGGGMAAQRAVNVDKDEGWRIKRQFDANYPGLRGWWQQQHNFAKKYKYVVTAFGRRYPLPDIDHEMRGFAEKAKRNAVNGPVQGTSADIIKMAMALIYKKFKKLGWLRRVLMTITIHDELVFQIPDDLCEQAIDILVPIMTRCKPILRLKWPVPLKVDIECGEDWTVPFNITELEHNQADNWTPRLAAAFPRRYAHYLSVGGKPLGAFTPSTVPEATETAPPTPQTAPPTPQNGTPDPAAPSKPTFKVPETGKGKVCTHIIHSSKLSWGLMDNLAKVIDKARDSGLETLRVTTEDGIVLWDDTNVLISATKFKVLAEEYGV